MGASTTHRTRVFISYSHKDSKYRYLDDLLEHLGVLENRGVLEVWSDRKIAAGDLWLDEIRQALASAKVAVLLVSPAFLNSRFIMDEEVPALLKAAREEGVKLLPVIVRPCLYNETELAPYQSVNSQERPVSGMDRTKKDQLWMSVAQRVLNALAASPAAGPGAASTANRPRNYLPLQPNPLFQERPGEFAELERLLLQQDHPACPGLVGMVGMGGVGKTSLAVEVATRYRSRFPAGTFWMPAPGQTQFDWQRRLAELARQTDYLPPDDHPGQPENEERRARHMARYLAENRDALLILDNVENPDLVVSALPNIAGEPLSCFLLYTSRQRNAPPGVTKHSVEKLPLEEALQLLLAATRPSILTEAQAGGQSAEVLAAHDLCQKVDYLPLGLVHLRHLLERNPLMTVTHLSRAVSERGMMKLAAKEYVDARPLFATFALSWEQVQNEDARRLFLLASYFPEANPIPLWLLGLAAGLGERWESWEPLGDAWLILQEQSLLEVLADGQVRLHPLIRDFGQQLVAEDGDQRKALLEGAGERLGREFTDLERLEQRIQREGYWGCLEQVRKVRDYIALLRMGQREHLERIERWLDRESYLFTGGQSWLEVLPGLFYQQLFNRAVEEGYPFSVERTPERWLRQLEQIGAEDCSLLRVFSGHTDVVASVAFSPDGSLVLTGSRDHTARLWKTDSGQSLAVLNHDGTVWKVVFSPDGSLVLTGSSDGIRMWKTDSGQLLSTFQGIGMAFSPDGNLILIRDDEEVRLWQVGNRQLLGTFSVSALHEVAFSPDGDCILTGSSDGTVRLWQVGNGQLLSTLQIDSKGEMRQMEFSPSGRLVFTSTRSLRFTPRGRLILPERSQIWQVSNGMLLRTLQDQDQSLNGVAFSPDDRLILTGSDDETARLWQVSSGKLLAILPSHTSSVKSVAFSADGSRMLTGSADHLACLWQVDKAQLFDDWESHTDRITSLVFSPDGNLVLSGSDDGTVRLWQTDSGKMLSTLDGHSEWVYSTAFSPDGSLALTGSADETARLWQVSDGQLITTLEHPGGRVYSAAFSPDGYYIRTGSGRPFFGEGAVWMWRTSDGQHLDTSYGFEEVVWSLAISPNHGQVFIGSGDHSARLFESSSGKLFATLDGHNKWVDSVAFSPDGRLVLTSSWDDTSRLWETSSGKQIAILEGHTAHVCNVAFSPDGHLAITCDNRGWVFFWQTSGMDIGHLLGLYVAAYAVGAVHWVDPHNVILADMGGRGGHPHFHRLKLEGTW